MENNMFNMNNVNKNLIRKNAKVQADAANFLKEHDAKLAEGAKKAEAKSLNEAMSGARFTNGSVYARSKARTNKLNEEIKYINESSVVAMTEMVSEVVEKALLLDESEFEALHPNYKDDIRETVRGLLENIDVPDVITNTDTLGIMEYVSKTLPSTKEGVSLTEDELANYISSKKTIDVDNAIDNLSGSVAGQVASLMEKEQRKIKEVQAELPKNKKDENQEELPPAEEEVPEELPEEEQEVAGETVEELPEEELASTSPTTGTPMPKKQIQMSPDGTLSVNIFESLVHETPRCGLIESLAVNEATNMLKDGKGYSPDLALANALMYVTITEALNVMGLAVVDHKMYKQITEAAGGKYIMNEGGIELKKNESIIDAMNRKGIKDKNGKEIKPETKAGDVPAIKERKALTETVICTQEAPRMNVSSDMSLAERIRAKKLAEQSSILHD